LETEILQTCSKRIQQVIRVFKVQTTFYLKKSGLASKLVSHLQSRGQPATIEPWSLYSKHRDRLGLPLVKINLRWRNSRAAHLELSGQASFAQTAQPFNRVGQ
jgi:hypothetical protein